MFARESLKIKLKKDGWSYRTAAPALGVSYQHLCMVLNGRRESRRLMRKIAELRPAGRRWNTKPIMRRGQQAK